MNPVNNKQWDKGAVASYMAWGYLYLSIILPNNFTNHFLPNDSPGGENLTFDWLIDLLVTSNSTWGFGSVSRGWVWQAGRQSAVVYMRLADV